jgi:hypothetical protein
LRFDLCYENEQWSESWRAPEQRLHEIQDRFSARGAVVRSGGDFDGWDMEVRAGLFATIRIKLLCEEHGNGHQLVRINARPHAGRLVPIMGVLFCGAVGLHLIGGPLAAALLCSLPMTVVWCRALYEWLVGMTFIIDVIENRETRTVSADAVATMVVATETAGHGELVEAVGSRTLAADPRQEQIEELVGKILSGPPTPRTPGDGNDESGVALKMTVDA